MLMDPVADSTQGGYVCLPWHKAKSIREVLCRYKSFGLSLFWGICTRQQYYNFPFTSFGSTPVTL